MSDGKLFCGTYAYEKWQSDSVKPYSDQITRYREKNPRGSNKNWYNGDEKGSPHKGAKRKLQALEKQNEELNRKLSALKSNAGGGDNQAAAREPERNDNAGDAFGGKNSMGKDKGDKG